MDCVIRIENVSRLTTGQGHCAEMFAIIQDGTPVSAKPAVRMPSAEFTTEDAALAHVGPLGVDGTGPVIA
jgi:hypothetical protein